ncbi:DUF2971 domain-containing protein [Reichenbachiella agariperforans]|uniref:DUF2971 domain-containing protein n=1 Tax=Reichenbachiella agariperforans TaxID=156994 RepID=UPI001C097949|nr:DUF2971 domain-containing protein [Reichenbachiella agariperforans]MBU2914236.1 DUF2971 domain-containing protein [Reichenbachiella agariperforans]
MKVYKYSPFDNYPIQNLKNHDLWFSKPSTFKDEWDSNLPVIDCDLEVLTKKYAEDLSKIPNEQLQGLSPPKGLFETLESKDTNDSSEQTLLKLICDYKDSFVGISCFTTKLNDQKMWEEYGDNHRGFCLCFETNLDHSFFKDLTEVQYEEYLSTVNYFSHDLVRELYIQYTTKLKNLVWEEEYRLLKHMSGKFSYNPKCLTEIILGKNISHKHSNTINNILQNSYENQVKISRN